MSPLRLKTHLHFRLDGFFIGHIGGRGGDEAVAWSFHLLLLRLFGRQFPLKVSGIADEEGIQFVRAEDVVAIVPRIHR